MQIVIALDQVILMDTKPVLKYIFYFINLFYYM